MSPLGIFVVFSTIIIGLNGKLTTRPPHCTQVTKNTDYMSKFKLDYPVVYIPPGQREAYQQMFCVKPAAVKTAVTTVCDWAAPPQVLFKLGDDYMHVVRQDPSGRFYGNAVITTYQLCSHNMTHSTQTFPIVTVVDEN